MFDAAIAASIRARTNHVEDFKISLVFAVCGKEKKRGRGSGKSYLALAIHERSL